MVKIYTHFSDSHQQLYEDFFKKSLRKLYSKNEVSIRCLQHKQTTADGMFMTNGWLEAMDFKLNVILTGIKETWNDWFIFADCDIQFFRPFIDDLKSELQKFDLVCQDDCNSLCAGFFACKSNDKTLNLFENIHKNFKSLVNDQVALNYFKHLIDYKLLDKQKYFTIGNFFDNIDGTHNWDNKTQITMPFNILLHHANYVKGVNNKIKLMQNIKNQFELYYLHEQ
jgi:hypothetical protein